MAADALALVVEVVVADPVADIAMAADALAELTVCVLAVAELLIVIPAEPVALVVVFSSCVAVALDPMVMLAVPCLLFVAMSCKNV